MKSRLLGLVIVMMGLTLVAAAFDVGALEAKKMAEIRADETLWQFLIKMPSSFEAQVFYGLFVSGLIGMLGSWAWKWSQKQTSPGHWTKQYVIGQLLWLAGSSLAAIFTVGFQTDDGVFFGWMAVLWSGGFAGCSGEVKVKTAEGTGS